MMLLAMTSYTFTLQMVLVVTLVSAVILWSYLNVKYYDRKNDFLFSDLSPELRYALILKALAGLNRTNLLTIRTVCDDLLQESNNVNGNTAVRSEAPTLPE